MQYLICLSDLLRAFQDQENIIVPVMFSWGEKLFCPYSYTHEDIREFESNNSLEARIGKQNVQGNKVYSGMERQKMYIWACKLFDLQVSRLPCPSLQFGLWLVNSITNHARITLSIFSKIYCTLESESVIYGEVLVSVLVVLPAVILFHLFIIITVYSQCLSTDSE